MPDVKISALPAATVALAGTEVLPIVQSATTRQVSVANLTAGRAVNALSLTASGLTSGRVTYAGTAGLLQDSDALTFNGTRLRTSGLDLVTAGGTANTIQMTGSTTAAVYTLYQNTGGNFYVGRDNSAGNLFGSAYASYLYSTGAYPMLFLTNDAERMRLDSSGNLLVGTTSATNSPFSSTSKFVVSGDFTGGFGQSITDTNTNTAVDHYLVSFNLGTASGNQKGYINFVGASGLVLYSTTSDQRLKTDLGVVTETSVIDNLLIHDYTWKESGVAGRGVFAQEAYEIMPNAIGKGKDAKDGSINIPWGVDYSKFVPDLIIHAQQLKKQVQEQQALIESLTTRLTALENK